ncbi:MAG: c-type cytochrome [Cytophagaceae bacterium]|jgi:cytochrome c peroxidase|nr:c-type cytochrome [Cytophagaceae bacterium]
MPFNNYFRLSIGLFAVLLGLHFTWKENANILQVALRLKRSGKLGTLNYESKKINADKAALGKLLFFDKRLSRNNNISCATCHVPELGFSNGQASSQGTHGKTLIRHVPHLYNLAWQHNFFWDGRAVHLEDQLKAVIESKDEMDMSLEEISVRLQSDSQLTQHFLSLFPGSGINPNSISQSLLEFERSIMAGPSRFDAFLEGDSSALQASEQRGLLLFSGKAGCIKCHSGAQFTDGMFHNVGVITEDLGRHRIDKIGMANEFESRPYPFFSNYKAFKTPTLRNLSFTAPYFHNGSKSELQEVIRFYNRGGDNPDRTGVAKEIKPLHLTDEEMHDLESFLRSLSAEKP